MDYFHLQQNEDELRSLSNLGLAYLGDAVYEVMVRAWLCLKGKATSGKLHRAALSYVTAPAQAAMAECIMPLLTDQEADVLRRGRNTKPHSLPKGAKRGEYQLATGLEALFGWLYLRGETERLNMLFETMMCQREGE
jgi:ribonuclease-3 family protein